MALFNSKRPSKIRRNVPTICHARPPIHPDSNVIKQGSAHEMSGKDKGKMRGRRVHDEETRKWGNK